VIFLKYKVTILLVLLVFSFVNNLIIGFENLKNITENADEEVFFMMVDVQIEPEKPAQRYIKTIYKYLIFYIFYFNIDDLPSVIKVLNYY
jgi:hypothetical protein